MPVDIIISEKIVGPGVETLAANFDVHAGPDLWRDPAKLKQLLPGCRALIVRNQTKVDADLLSAAPELQVIGRAGAGLDNIEVPAATARGIVVASTPDQNSISVA